MAQVNNDTDGLIKFLADAETDRILGIHIVGPSAGELIAEGSPAIPFIIIIIIIYSTFFSLAHVGAHRRAGYGVRGF